MASCPKCTRGRITAYDVWLKGHPHVDFRYCRACGARVAFTPEWQWGIRALKFVCLIILYTYVVMSDGRDDQVYFFWIFAGTLGALVILDLVKIHFGKLEERTWT